MKSLEERLDQILLSILRRGSTPVSTVLCQRWHYYYITISFSCGRVKAIKKRHAWKRPFSKKEEKISIFTQKRICVDRGYMSNVLWTCLVIFSTNQLMRKCLLLTGWQMKKNLNRCPNTPLTQSHNQLQMGVWFKALLISVLFLEISRQISFNQKMTVRFWLESLVQ